MEKSFTVISDYKPLMTICAKPLHVAPPRLQRMLLNVQGYNFTVIYRSGDMMTLADTLSRLPNPQKNAEIHLDERVDGIDTCIDDVNISVINFSTEK